MPDKDAQDQDRTPVEASLPLPGDLLAGQRRKHGWTLERVAQELNLDAGIVLALEENRFEILGAPVFARGHLRKYAELLEINPDEVLASYDAIAADTETPELPPAGPGPTAIVRRRSLGPVAAVLAVAAIAVLLWRIVGNGTPEATDVVTGDAAEDAALPEESAPASVTQDLPPSRETPIVLPDNEPDSPGAVAAPESDAGSRPEPEVTPAPPPDTAVADAVPAPVTVEQTPAVRQMRIAMRFTADSWVEVRDADGARLVYQLQREGTARSVSGTPPFRLFLGFADGVEIEVDGQPLSIPAERRLGNTARFEIPLEADGVSRR